MTRGRRGPARAAARLLLTWAACYFILLQSVAGALAFGTMAGGRGSAPLLCTAGNAAPADGVPHDGIVRGLHCLLCPAAGAIPVLAGPPALPLPFLRMEGASAPGPAGIAPGVASICENARSRAPPARG
ncbi:hypothetical protein ACI7BZ_16170 [Xanthobacter sp. AM11]|uniref:hypothetical protein n=1 Tax=Xanthobacter sp. AM11 TaxID=3380643 RepID=UPI0039BFBD02